MGPGLTVNTAAGSLQWSDKRAPSAVICPFDLSRSHRGAEGGRGGGREARAEGEVCTLVGASVALVREEENGGFLQTVRDSQSLILPLSLHQG